MSSRKQTSAERTLLPAIARELSDALLPGDEGFGKAGLEDAARFVLAAALRREAGEPVIAIESVTGAVDQRLTVEALLKHLPSPHNLPQRRNSICTT